MTDQFGNDFDSTKNTCIHIKLWQEFPVPDNCTWIVTGTGIWYCLFQFAVQTVTLLCLSLHLAVFLGTTPLVDCSHSLDGVALLNRGETFISYKPRIVSLRVSLRPHFEAVKDLQAKLSRFKLLLHEAHVNGSNNFSYETHQSANLLNNDLCDVVQALKDIKSVILSPSKLSESHASGRMEKFPMEGPVLSTLSKILDSKANPGNARDRPNLVRERNAHMESLLQQSVITSNDSLSEISRNRKALSDITYAADFFEQGMENLTSWYNSQISDHNLASNVDNHINTILSMTSYRLRRTINSLERIRDGLQFSLGGHISPLLLDEDQLPKMLRKVRNRVGISHQNAWPFAEKRWDLFYQMCPVSILPYKDSVIIVFIIPFLVDSFWRDKLTLYQFLQVPVAHDNHTAFVYDIDAAGIAVTKDHRYYALLSQGELDLCGQKTIQFCQFSSPLYEMEETLNCMTSLFKKSIDLAEEHCLLKSVPFDRPVAKYLFDNKWMIYSPYEWQLVTDCLFRLYNDSLNANINIPAGVCTIDVEYECKASGVFFILPAKSRSGKDFVRNTRFDYRFGPVIGNRPWEFVSL